MVKKFKGKYEDIYSSDNLLEAYRNARRGKTKKPAVIAADEDPLQFLIPIHEKLRTKTYKSGEYRAFRIRERDKTREVFDVDFEHRVVHWALMLQIKPMIMNYIGDGHSFGAMEGRGVHMALTKLSDALRRDPEGTRYCLKIDVRKFFPSIDKDLMMKKLERRIKDKDILALCSEIIYGFPGNGLPIGNYTSQYFANFFLADIDRYMTQTWHCKHYFRYMDDIVILGSSKSWLRRARRKLAELLEKDHLTMKGNWQIFPVDRGIDFIGYRTFREHRLLRNLTKRRLKGACRRIRHKLRDGEELDIHDLGCLASYARILSWCDGYGLGNKTIYSLFKRGEEPWKRQKQLPLPAPSSS